jgi:hypothetical protein
MWMVTFPPLSLTAFMTVVVCIINHPNAAAGTVAQDALLRFAYDGADPGPLPVVSARP